MKPAPTVLVVDHYDSFTYNLVAALQGLAAKVTTVQHDATELETFATQVWTGIVLSPGPGKPSNSRARKWLPRWLGQTSVLGVCLGHQLLAEYFGGRVVHAYAPQHGQTSPMRHTGAGSFRGLGSRPAFMRYHSLVVEPASLPNCLEPIAWAESGELMAFRHTALPVEGWQFHPESVLSLQGEALLANWLRAAVAYRAVPAV